MYAEANEVEATLLASISDDASLDVYADWLEERGHEDRAEFLRLHKKLRSSTWKNPYLVDRFTILSRNVDPMWRERVVPVKRIELPPPVPAAVQLPPAPAPRRRMRREIVVPPVTWMPPKVPAWIRVSSTFAYVFIVVAFVLYWLT